MKPEWKLNALLGRHYGFRQVVKLVGTRNGKLNFWKPSGAKSFLSLDPGEPLLFKLDSPNIFIVGSGFFSHYTVLPANFAWGAFGKKNGAETDA